MHFEVFLDDNNNEVPIINENSGSEVEDNDSAD